MVNQIFRIPNHPLILLNYYHRLKCSTLTIVQTLIPLLSIPQADFQPLQLHRKKDLPSHPAVRHGDHFLKFPAITAQQHIPLLVLRHIHRHHYRLVLASRDNHRHHPRFQHHHPINLGLSILLQTTPHPMSNHVIQAIPLVQETKIHIHQILQARYLPHRITICWITSCYNNMLVIQLCLSCDDCYSYCVVDIVCYDW